MLHFMADEYDDTCATIFPLLSTVLLSVSVPARQPPMTDY